MARSHLETPREIIDLLTDDEDDAFSEDEPEFFDAPLEQHLVDEDRHGRTFQALNARYNPVYEPADGVIDLTGIPDIDVPPSDPSLQNHEVAEASNASEGERIITVAVCLQMVLDVLPDISVDHVLNLIETSTTDITRTAAHCETIITQLLDGESYPKEIDDANNKKRKRDDEHEWKGYEKDEWQPDHPTYETDA